MIAIEQQVQVPLSQQQAFHAFVDAFHSWWPRRYTWSGEGLMDIRIAPHAGGFCSEFGPHGFRCDWGQVLVWDPDEQLTFSWQ
jgi:hypothetical protein